MDSISQLIFKGYIVNYIEFKLNPNFKGDTAELKMNFDKSISTVDPENAVVRLTVNVFKNALEKQYPFEFNVTMSGAFDITGVDENDRKIMLNQNCIAILFPYLRALITTYTAMANIPPLVLPAINIAKMLEEADEESQE